MNSRAKGCTEEWRNAPMFEDRYEISSFGRLRCHINSSSHLKKYRGKIISVDSTCDKGYPQRSLYDGSGKRRTVKIHRLVALAFIGPKPSGMMVNHIDGIKTNNNVDNLEYVTNRQNVIHAYALGLINNSKGEAHSRPKKLCIKDVILIRKMVAEGSPRKVVASMFGVHQMTIGEIVRKEIWAWAV